jgi:hypothetical protein
MNARLGVDVGGTFTDLALWDVEHRRLTVLKIPSVSHDPSAGIIAGLRGILERDGIPPSALGFVAHGTTVAVASGSLASGSWRGPASECGRLRHGLREEVDHTGQGPTAHTDFGGLVLERECREGEVVSGRFQVEIPPDRGEIIGKRTRGVGRPAQSKARVTPRRLLFNTYPEGSHPARISVTR